MAAAVRVQQTRSGRGRHRAVETGDRRRAARPHGRASGDRGERRRPGPQPHAGVRTPELCPHRMSPGGVGVTASTRPIRAPRWLALDNAINLEAAATKRIVSPVAGRANVLIVPDLESGNMLAKSLTFLAGATAAGIVLGARVPIILTSRADSLTTRIASCAIAALVAAARRETPAAA